MVSVLTIGGEFDFSLVHRREELNAKSEFQTEAEFRIHFTNVLLSLLHLNLNMLYIQIAIALSNF